MPIVRTTLRSSRNASISDVLGACPGSPPGMRDLRPGRRQRSAEAREVIHHRYHLHVRPPAEASDQVVPKQPNQRQHNDVHAGASDGSISSRKSVPALGGRNQSLRVRARTGEGGAAAWAAFVDVPGVEILTDPARPGDQHLGVGRGNAPQGI